MTVFILCLELITRINKRHCRTDAEQHGTTWELGHAQKAYKAGTAESCTAYFCTHHQGNMPRIRRRHTADCI